MNDEYESNEDLISDHGSDRDTLMATIPPAPATGPRCGGTPGKPGYFAGSNPDLEIECKGCPDCQPAPTPSGDSAPYWKDDDVLDLLVTETDGYRREWRVPRAVSAAIRAESAAALQEARQQLSAMNRELAALSSDKQTLMTATTHWRDGFLAEEARHLSAVARAEAAEGERKRLGGALAQVDAALRRIAELTDVAGYDSGHVEVFRLANEARDVIIAASRPVPAAPQEEQTR